MINSLTNSQKDCEVAKNNYFKIISLISVDSLEKAGLYGLISVFVFHMMSGLHLTGANASVFANIMRSMFYLTPIASVFLTFFFKRISIAHISLFVSASLYAVIYFFSGNTPVFIIAAIGISAVAGVLKPILPDLIIQQCQTDKMRSMSVVASYWGLNLLCVPLESLTPIAYNAVSPKFAIMCLAVISAITFAMYFLVKRTITDGERGEPISIGLLLAPFSKARQNKLNDQERTLVMNLKYFAPYFVAMFCFFVAYEQMYAGMLVHGTKMDCVIFGKTIIPYQAQIVNSILVITITPLARKYIVPTLDKTKLFHTQCGKILFGSLFLFVGFSILLFLEVLLSFGMNLTITLDMIVYFFITISEMFCVVYGLEIALTRISEHNSIVPTTLFFLMGFCANMCGAFVSGMFTTIGIPFFTIMLMFCFACTAISFYLVKKTSI